MSYNLKIVYATAGVNGGGRKSRILQNPGVKE